MEKYIYDKNNVLWYELQGDYYIPCLTVPAKEERPIGIWGQRHLEETGRQGGDRGRFSVSLVLYCIFYDFLGNPWETV